jgi:hypothetical protein
MKRLLAIVAIVLVLAGIGWSTASGFAGGLYRYAEAGFPSYPFMEDCPLSHRHYRFEGDVLIEFTCIGG